MTGLARLARGIGRDALASFVVFLVALPLCMGVAIASGVPPALGLVSGIVGGILVGAFAGAPLQVSGPAAGLTVIVWEAVQNHGVPGMAMMVLLGGALQLGAGMLRLGRWFRAVSPAVIGGMLTGIGVLIAVSQIHVMVDDAPRASGIANLLSIPESIYKGVVPSEGSSHHLAALIGLLTLALLIGSERIKSIRALPGALVAVAVASIVASLMGMPINYVTVPENLWAELTIPTLASVATYMSDPAIWFGGIGMGVIASAESLLCATALDKMHDGPRTHYDAEMRAQGLGNLLCGVVGALPVTGVIVRSTANIEAGGRTRLSTILHGVWLLVMVVTLPQVLRLVPTSSLAAILVFTGYKLMSPARVRELAKQGVGELVVFAGTVVAIVATDLLKGVVAGVILALAKLLVESMRLSVRIRQDDETNTTDIEVTGVATFVRLPELAAALEQVAPERNAKVRLYLQHLDHACLELLTEWERQRQAVSSAKTEMSIHASRSPGGPSGVLRAGAVTPFLVVPLAGATGGPSHLLDRQAMPNDA